MVRPIATYLALALLASSSGCPESVEILGEPDVGSCDLAPDATVSIVVEPARVRGWTLREPMPAHYEVTASEGSCRILSRLP